MQTWDGELVSHAGDTAPHACVMVSQQNFLKHVVIKLKIRPMMMVVEFLFC